ncbi:hypothetical protein Glove_118g18 [Diversispora epigaea]|uniref:Uncharacterized protein n=1 Tax=Diversispora epigaea TaxID=1348612 RepID=A0A397J9W8_9GLOM|nr:hypothetical protein Glove_118g18 [Diversispora epigaea]
MQNVTYENNPTPIFNPNEAARRYFSKNKDKKRKVDSGILNIVLTVFCFTDEDELAKILRSEEKVYIDMLSISASLIKEMEFKGTPEETIDTKIESEFEILHNKNWIVYRPCSNSGLFLVERSINPYTILIISRLTSNRKKLYIGLFNLFRNGNNNEQEEELVASSSSLNIRSTSEINNEQEVIASSSSYNPALFEQLDYNNYELFENTNDDILNETSPIFSDANIFKNLLNFLRMQKKFQKKSQQFDDPNKDIFCWIQKCDNKTLLDIPEIKLVNEVGIDSGGIIHDVLQNFWNILLARTA